MGSTLGQVQRLGLAISGDLVDYSVSLALTGIARETYRETVVFNMRCAGRRWVSEQHDSEVQVAG